MTLSEKIDIFLSDGHCKGYKFTLAEISFEANMVLNTDYYYYRKKNSKRFLNQIHGISVILNPRINGATAVINFELPYKKGKRAKVISA